MVVGGLGLNARRASDSVHSLLYIDGAANLCQSQSESHAAARLKVTLPNHTDGRAGRWRAWPRKPVVALEDNGEGRTEGMCRSR